MTFHEHATQLDHLAQVHVPEGLIPLYGGQ